MDKKTIEFLNELNQLSRKHGIIITGFNGDPLYNPYVSLVEDEEEPILGNLEWDCEQQKYTVCEHAYGDEIEYE